MKTPILYEFDLKTMARPSLIAVVHIDDRNNDSIELKVTQGGAVVDLSNKTVTARFVMRRTHELINDNVSCTVNESGNIVIPFDRPAVETAVGDMNIEVNIAETNGELTLQFPLWVRVNGSILDGAEVTPRSQGTIPELIEEVRDELARVKDFTTREDVFDVIDEVFSETEASVVPRLCVELYEGDYWLTYYDSEEKEAHRLFNVSSILPSVPTKTSELQNDSGFMPIVEVSSIDSCTEEKVLYRVKIGNYTASYIFNVIHPDIWGQFKIDVNSGGVLYRAKLRAYPDAPWGQFDDFIAFENTFYKVTSLTAQSTDEQYPSAKAVYDALKGKANTNHTHSQYLTSHQSLAGLIGTDKVYEILDSALSGDPSNIPALLVDNTVDQTHNPDGHYILYYIDSDEVRHNIFDISEYFVGKTSETVTKTVTLFDGTAINETLSEANSNLRYVIWGTTGAHLSFEAGKTYHIEITCTEVNLSSVTSVRLMHYPNGSTLTNYQIFAPVVSGNVLTCDYTVPENCNGLLLRLNAKAGAQNVSLKVTTEEETEIAVSNSDALPSYCADEIGRVKKAVLDQANYGDVVFGVFTDLHFAENDSEASAAQKWNAIKIMRRLADETILDFVIQGGDLLTNGYYENDTYKLNKAQNLFSGCRAPLYTSKGDHDSNQTDTKITKSDFAKRTAPYMPKAIRSADYPNNYYFDLPEKKTRVINIDTGTVMAGQGNNGAEYKTWGNETLYNWLLDEVLTDEVKTGWKFIVFTHAPCDCEWQFGMAKRFRASHSTDISNSQNSAKGNMLAINDLFEAINSAGTFSTDKEFHRYTLTHDSDNVLQSAVQTSDAMGGDVYGISGIYQEQATSTQFIRTKSFSGWTSKARMILSGHCHCDRLNKSTLKPDGSGNYVRGTASYAIAYTAAAAYNGYKDASTYYIPCFGADGQIASWGHIQTSDRTLGTLGEQLMDVWIVGDTCVRRVRFGAGAGNALLSSVINV